uniref:DUF4283 domain-containing protein n=1 Tax=Tanacetum cinerariifolium TaxID=118510 RepID=A0A699GJ21_TANCI|nr:hypothetical protein [Tanacetum cinerariifolium]
MDTADSLLSSSASKVKSIDDGKIAELSNDENVKGADVATPLAVVDENIWLPNSRLKKNEIAATPVWVKLHNVPIIAYSEIGLSLITTKLGQSIMLDAYMSIMCLKSWGRNNYARALIEVSSKKAIVDSLVVAIPFQDEKCPKHAKDVNLTQVSDDGFVEVIHKNGKGKHTSKPRHIDGVWLTKPKLNYYYRPISKKATTQPNNKGKDMSLHNLFDALMEEGKIFEVNNKTWKASNDVMDDSDSEEVKNIFVEDNEKPMDSLVDDVRKKVDAPPKKAPMKTAKKDVKNHDPLALVAYSNDHSSHSYASPLYSHSSQPYYVSHPSSVIDHEEDYQGEIQGDAQEDKLTNAMMLLARAITQRYSTPTNNRLHTSSNTRRSNRNQIATAGNGMVQHIEANDHIIQEHMLSAMKDEAGGNLNEEGNEFMHDNHYGDDSLEELNITAIMMAHIQPADINDDAEPKHDSKSISKVNSFIIFDDPYVDNNDGTDEHDSNAHDQSVALESLIYNGKKEAESKCSLNNELKNKKHCYKRNLRRARNGLDH